MRADDSSLEEVAYANVRTQAERLLREADALGMRPTPVDRLLSVAGLQCVTLSFRDAWRELFQSCRAKRVDSKLIGLLDARDGIVYIEEETHPRQQPFLKMHEVAHSYLAHQRELYEVLEESEATLTPEVGDLFEREANVFASEVLFQLDAFQIEARSYPFGLDAVLKLAQRFGASAYSAMRRYVSMHDDPCALFVLDGLRDGAAPLRRIISSESFRSACPALCACTELPGELVSCLPLGISVSELREVVLPDSGLVLEAQGFDSSFKLFVLVRKKGESSWGMAR